MFVCLSVGQRFNSVFSTWGFQLSIDYLFRCFSGSGLRDLRLASSQLRTLPHLKCNFKAQSVLQIKHTISEQQNSNKIRLKTPNKNYIAKNTFGSKRVRRPFRFQSRQNLKYSTNFL